MPQTFQVLRCFQCLVFQVHPTNKANKWKCTMCGEKQSIKRFYGLGTGKECRLHVQKLNRIQGEIHSAKLNSEDRYESSNSPDSIEQVETDSNSEEQNESVAKAIIKKSKWADYVEMADENEQYISEQTIDINEAEVVLEFPKKLPQKTPQTRVFNNSIKDKSVESKQCNTYIHTRLTDLPAETKILNKEVLLPTVSNSKWAQYVEETENLNDDDASVNDQANFQKHPPKRFSLFDDEDLDAVLDF